MTQLTLKLIKSKDYDFDGWERLLKSLNKTEADNTPVSISHILDSNGIDDTLSVIFNCIDGRFEQKLGMLKEIGESQLHLWEKETGDTTVRNYLDVCCDINSTEEQRNAAKNAAKNATMAVARDVVRANVDSYAAAEAAMAARAAARARAAFWAAAIWSAARARAAFWAAADAAMIARAAARAAADAAGKAARDDERKKQKQIILKYFGNV